MEPKKNSGLFNSTTITFLIVGLLVGFAGGTYWSRGENSTTADLPTPPDGNIFEDSFKPSENVAASALLAPAGRPTAEGEGSVSAVEQSAGSQVLADATLTAIGWVAVREVAQGGGLGPILGAKRLEAGSHQGAVVELLQATKPGTDYYLVLYRDDGDLAFDFTKDAFITKNGQLIAGQFSTL